MVCLTLNVLIYNVIVHMYVMQNMEWGNNNATSWQMGDQYLQHNFWRPLQLSDISNGLMWIPSLHKLNISKSWVYANIKVQNKKSNCRGD